MNEGLLSLAWEKGYYDASDLRSLDGKKLCILHPGTRNIHQGPDFYHAVIAMDGIRWAGTVEIHVNGADWYRHGHDRDPNYNSVVLHVVYEPALPPPIRADGAYVPELLFRPQFDENVLSRYEQLASRTCEIPCVVDENVARVGEKIAGNWLETLAEARFEQKSRECRALLRSVDGDWEQALWITLAGAFAGPENKEAFVAVARTAHRKYLARSLAEKNAATAMLLGASGFIPSRNDDSPYINALVELWTHLRQKFEIVPAPVSFSWLRMRPAAFPIVRWVQLAAIWEKIYENRRSLLDYCRKPELLFDDCKRLVYDEYWKKRINIGHTGKIGVPRPGKDFLSGVLINALHPIARLYADEHNQPEILNDWRKLFCGLPPENNRLTRPYKNAGFPNHHPLHSQGIVALQRNYCKHKRCLECDVGRTLLTIK